MAVSYFDVKCEVKQDEDGTCAVIISVGNLSYEEAMLVVAETRAPFREAIMKALGAKEVIGTVDMLRPMQ